MNLLNLILNLKINNLFSDARLLYYLCHKILFIALRNLRNLKNKSFILTMYMDLNLNFIKS